MGEFFRSLQTGTFLDAYWNTLGNTAGVLLILFIGILIFLFVAFMAERKTRVLFPDRKKRSDDDEGSFFDFDDDDDDDE